MQNVPCLTGKYFYYTLGATDFVRGVLDGTYDKISTQETRYKYYSSRVLEAQMDQSRT